MQKLCIRQTLVSNKSLNYVLQRGLGVSALRGDISAENEVKEVLSNIIEPITGKTLSAIGSLRSIKANKSNGNINVDIDMMVPGHPYLQSIKNECELQLKTNIKTSNWIKNIQSIHF